MSKPVAYSWLVLRERLDSSWQGIAQQARRIAAEDAEVGPRSQGRSTRTRALLLVLAALLIVSRAPDLLFQPRFWAEEATTYFAYAYQNPLLRSLFLVSADQASYLAVSASMPATVAAHALPLELAPCATTFSSFLIQLAPFVMVLLGRSSLWKTLGQRAMTCLILLFGPPLLVGEVWLNSINAQVYCGIIAVVLLFEQTEGRGRRVAWSYRVVLGFCGLAGPYTGFLTPAFLWRYWRSREREAGLHAAIVGSALAIQGAVHLATRAVFPFAPTRLFWGWSLCNWAERAAGAFIHLFLGSFFGCELTPSVALKLGIQDPNFGYLWPDSYIRLVLWSTVLVMAAVVAALSRRPGSDSHCLLAVAFVSVVAPTFFLAPIMANRYAAVGGTLLLLLTAACVWDRTRKVRSRTATVLLVLTVAAGASTFWRDVSGQSPLGHAPGRRSWVAEVGRWRRDQSGPLMVWPYTDRPPWLLRIPSRNGGDGSCPYLSVHPFAMISQGEEEFREIAVSGLPEDFRLLINLVSTQDHRLTRLELEFLDETGASVYRGRLRGFQWHKSHWFNMPSNQVDLRDGAQLRDVRKVRLAFSSSAGVPHRVSVEQLVVTPRVLGLLDGVLGFNPRLPWVHLSATEVSRPGDQAGQCPQG